MDYENAASVNPKNGRYSMSLYHQAGNTIPVTIFESIFRKIILGETEEQPEGQLSINDWIGENQ